jgi:pimeloyl-ACP methyl ester carboxylesterase
MSRLGVYTNWFRLDPWFAPRYYIRDFWHPRSPLSSTTLVHRAFFSPEFPRSNVKEFEELMPEYESILWPLQMMFSFVNVQNVLKSIFGWEREGSRLLVIAGDNDTLMGVPLMRKMAAAYRSALSKIFSRKSAMESELSGVQFTVIEGSGHHIQNDLEWETCADEVLGFLEQL